MYNLHSIADFFCTPRKWVMTLLIGVSLFGWLPFSQAQSARLILRNMATQCVDNAAHDYCQLCSTPRSDSTCPMHDVCKKSIDVWAQTTEFFAMRDIKMCGCRQTSFVHGLVIPRQPITGVEDPARPESIWAFAWQVGLSKIPADELALAVNPQGQRSQDQLHVHVVRLQQSVQSQRQTWNATQLDALTQVWQTAQRLAEARGLRDYGVLITQHPQGGYALLVDAQSPEYQYTQALCP